MAENKSIYDLSDISTSLTNDNKNSDLPELGNKSIYDLSNVSQQQENNEYWFEGDGFLNNIAEGFTIGGRGLIAGFQYITAQFEDNPLKKYELTKWADEYIKKSPKSDDSAGQWIGQLIPSIIPTTGAVVTSMIPGGQPIAGALGTLGISALATSSAGMGLKQYDDEKLALGKNPYDNPLERLAVASMYGASEYIFERFALNKFLPKPIRDQIKNTKGKFTIGGNKIDTKTATDVFADFVNKKGISPRTLATLSSYEGGTEVATQLGQELADYWFLENKKSADEIAMNVGEAFAGGFLMGTGIGTLSFKAQDINNQRRREKQGDVFITEYNGKSYEVIGKNEKNKKVTLLDAQGKTVEVKESEIGDLLTVSNKQFENIL